MVTSYCFLNYSNLLLTCQWISTKLTTTPFELLLFVRRAVPVDVFLGSFRVDVLAVGKVETSVIVLGVIGAVFSGSPSQDHRRVSHADGHAVFKVRGWNGNKKVATKQTGHAFAFSEGLASRLCSDLKSQKGELPSPAGTERISKNMLYSIVEIDYHKIRGVST